MLFKGGAVSRQGKVDQKTSVSDYTTDEQEKMASVYATVLNCPWTGKHFFMTDTPGYGEFICEMMQGMDAADAAVVVVDGVNGVEVGTARAWKLAKKKNLPRMILINRLDKERADFSATLTQIQDAYGKTTCVPLTMPVGKEDGFEKVVNVLTEKNPPADIADELETYREQLMDTIAESNEDLMMKYLEGEELSAEEIASGLRGAVLSGDLVPVLAGSVEKDIGISELMDSAASLFPAPLSVEKKNAEGKVVESKEDGTGTALVFKSIVDPFIGQLTFFRVVSGTFKADSEVFNVSRKSKERFGPIYLMNGKNQEQIDEVGPGAMVGMAKLKDTRINNTLATKSDAEELEKIKFPEPVMSYAVTAVKSGEEEKISSGLSRISESDPGVRIARNSETRELILSGMGDQHLTQTLKKLKETSKVEVEVHSPKIPYRETITASGEGHYRHKKQTGGHGQFAEVYLRIASNSEGFEFINEVVGGNIPKNFIPAVEKGVVEAMERGPLAGCVVQNIAVTVYDGKHHPVDSSEMAFKIASRTAFRNAMGNAKPILLEPIQDVKIMIPDDYMGDITGDLNHKRGRILGMSAEEGMQVVNAEVPLSEMARYATELRSMTQGRGLFEMSFARYEMVPSNVAKEIIDAHKKEQEEAQ
jgi:elongation factor G